MKKFLLLTALVFSMMMGLTAQVVVNADITSNTTWTKNNIYLLQGGCLYVTNNATLTIEPGTIIKGDAAALIIQRGSKLIADGTPEQPIVFTSSKAAGQRNPGDWGGIVLLGKAPINVPGGESTVEGGCALALYGGTEPADNSGILRYVRVEFAGIPFIANNELNSLTLGGVGTGTIIEHVQSSYGGDDAFEWFGGTVNGKFLVTFRTVDDMFDTDFGYQGKNQWVLGISDPNIADVSGSNAFESDNDAQGSTNSPKTDADFSNVTILGPLTQSATINSNFRRAAHIRRCSYQDIYNSALTGFNFGLLLDGACTVDGFAVNGEVDFVSNTLANVTGKNVVTTVAASLPAIFTEFTASGNDSLASFSGLLLNNPFAFNSNPDFRPGAGSPLLSGATTLSDPFFTATTYRGAMGDTDWTDCWCEWDPVNANYDVAPISYITKPVVTAGGTTTFCTGGSVVLTAPAGFASYLWSNGATTETITVTTAGNYTVTVKTARGCASTSDAVAVTVNATPSCTASNNGPICSGQTLNLTSTSNGTSWSWTGPNNFTSSLQNPTIANATAAVSGTYTVVVTSAAGCQSTCTTSATVNAAPTCAAGSNSPICSGQTLNLTSTSNGTSWSWTGPNNFTSSLQNPTIANATAAASGTYTVVVTGAGGCQSTCTSSATVNPTPTANFTFTINASTVIFQNTSTAANTYLWNFGDGTTSTAASLSHTYAAAGNYNVCLTANTTAGCTNQICIDVTGVQAPIPNIQIINADITTSTTWTNNNIYVLQGGCIYVTNDATLTIQPGTIIKGDAAALIIQRGSKLIADGTPEQPIVFTSNKPAGQRAPGDWGGIGLLGKAPINVPGGESTLEGGCTLALYGGTDPADNSGLLRYVRIEFAGIPLIPNNELNSLTLGGVGTGTVIEHVQSSYGGDDAFEWFGGSVNGKFLLTFRTVDDMFDTDFGYQGNNQWVLGISDPNLADVSGSNAFESDNDAQGSTNGPKTDAGFSNVTILGPLAYSPTVNSNFRRAAHIRRCSYQDIFNSALTGFPIGLLLDGACTVDGFTTGGEVELVANTFANASGKNVTVAAGQAASLPAIFTAFTASGNDSLASVANLLLNNALDFSTGNPDFRPAAGSPLLSGADFTSQTLTNPFFTATTYRGAMGDTDWTDCWCEFDPINANYETAPINYLSKPTASPLGATTFCSGGSVTLSAPIGAGYSYEWSNGATTQTINVTTAGSYTVTVRTARGCASTSDAVAVTVNPTPTADFNFTVVGATVVFANASSGATTYLWNFGDGATSTAPSISHTYAAAGSYTVTLTATSSAGCTSTVTKTVNGVTSGVPNEVLVNAAITASATWTNNNIYILQNGCIYVRDGVTLTIEPGTVIRGEGAALIVQRGAKLIAEGTPAQPIVFTSNRPAGQRAPGDWGGIALLGKAPINVPGGESTLEGGCTEALYGGTAANDNSGTLRYVRIEFAGIPLIPNNELNSLTLGGVGTGTVIEHVQSSYGGDDAFEWFGGTVNGKFLVTFRTVDDMFDTDFGYQGKNQWVLGISDPNLADVSGSNGFESDNDAQGSTNGPKTDAGFSNVTILGPLDFSTTINTNFRRVAHIRRCSYQDIFNSALTGFPIGLLLDGACTVDGFTTGGEVELVANTFANASGKNVTVASGQAASLPAIFTEFTASGNDSLASVTNLALANPFAFAGNNPDFRPNAGSPLLSGADFTSPTVMDPFFTATTYRGAMGDTDWTDCWTEWDPINAAYTNSINYGLTPGIASNINDHVVSFTGTTAGAVSYTWDFGDGSAISTEENPTHTYAGSVGAVEVTLTVTSARGCVTTTTATVGLTATHEVAGLTSLKVFPNPTSGNANVDFMLRNQMEISVQLIDLNGRVVRAIEQEFRAGFNRHELNTNGLNTGVYFLRLLSADGQQTVRISVIK